MIVMRKKSDLSKNCGGQNSHIVYDVVGELFSKYYRGIVESLGFYIIKKQSREETWWNLRA
jgi:hypothetical protein